MIKQKNNQKGITIIALIVTIIILLILAGVTIATLSGENGLLNKTEKAKEENEKQSATEIINLKITNAQMESYRETESMPNLQYLANMLCKDEEIQYVELETQKLAALKEISVGNSDAIYTKLKDYNYEFKINKSLKLEAINGVEIAEKEENKEDTTTISKAEWEDLKTTVASLKNKVEEVKTISLDFDTDNWSSGSVTCTYSAHSCTVSVRDLVKKTSEKSWVKLTTLPKELTLPSLFVAVPVQGNAGQAVKDRIIVEGNQVFIETHANPGEYPLWGGITYTY